MESRDIIIAAIGVVLGVLFEDPLTRLKDIIIHQYKRLFYKRPSKIHQSEKFSFGQLKTPWIIIDGDGEADYSPKTIMTHFDNYSLELPTDLLKRKKDIQRKEKEKQKKGHPFFWNGERYYLDKFLINRTESEEDLTLSLWFRPTDFHTFLATNISLDENDLREKYISNVDWMTTPPKFFSNDFAVYLVVVTEDEYTLFPKRSDSVGVYKNTYNISVTEGLSRSLDRGVNNLAPDVYRCAIRGIAEELGVTDTTASDIVFLSFGVNTRYVQWSLLGMVKVDKKIEEILEYRPRGVKDKWENSEFNIVKFELHEILTFVFSHEPWAPGALACLYHALVHEFGRSEVDKAISQYEKQK